MLESFDLPHAVRLLKIYRRNLQIIRNRIAIREATTGDINELEMSIDAVAGIKNIIRNNGYTVEDDQLDTFRPTVKIEQDDNIVVLAMPEEIYNLVARVMKNGYATDLEQYIVN